MFTKEIQSLQQQIESLCEKVGFMKDLETDTSAVLATIKDLAAKIPQEYQQQWKNEVARAADISTSAIDSEDLFALKQEAEQLRKAVEESQRQEKQWNDLEEKLESQLDAIAKENKSLLNRCSSLELDNNALISENQELKLQPVPSQDTETLLAAIKKENQELLDRYSSLESENEAIAKENQQLVAQSFQSEISPDAEMLIALQKENKELQEEIASFWEKEQQVNEDLDCQKQMMVALETIADCYELPSDLGLALESRIDPTRQELQEIALYLCKTPAWCLEARLKHTWELASDSVRKQLGGNLSREAALIWNECDSNDKELATVAEVGGIDAEWNQSIEDAITVVDPEPQDESVAKESAFAKVEEGDIVNCPDGKAGRVTTVGAEQTIVKVLGGETEYPTSALKVLAKKETSTLPSEMTESAPSTSAENKTSVDIEKTEVTLKVGTKVELPSGESGTVVYFATSLEGEESVAVEVGRGKSKQLVYADALTLKCIEQGQLGKTSVVGRRCQCCDGREGVIEVVSKKKGVQIVIVRFEHGTTESFDMNELWLLPETSTPEQEVNFDDIDVGF